MGLFETGACLVIERTKPDATRGWPAAAVQQPILHAPSSSSVEQQVDVIVAALIPRDSEREHLSPFLGPSALCRRTTRLGRTTHGGSRRLRSAARRSLGGDCTLRRRANAAALRRRGALARSGFPARWRCG